MPKTAGAAGPQDLSSPARSFAGLLVTATPNGGVSTGKASSSKNAQLTQLEFASGTGNAPANSAATFDWMTTVSSFDYYYLFILDWISLF